MTENKSAEFIIIPIQKETMVLQEANSYEVFETVRHLKNEKDLVICFSLVVAC